MAPRSGSWGRLNGQIPGTCTEKFTSAPPCERKLTSKLACFWCRSAPQALEKMVGTRGHGHVLELRAGYLY